MNNIIGIPGKRVDDGIRKPNHKSNHLVVEEGGVSPHENWSSQ